MAKKIGNARERRDEILKHLSEKGCFGIPRETVQEIAREFKCSERQVYLDVQTIISKIDFPEVNKISKQFFFELNHIMRSAHKLTCHKDPNIQIKGLTLLNQTISNYTSFLENYGFKDKVDERLSITSGMSEESLSRIANLLS